MRVICLAVAGIVLASMVTTGALTGYACPVHDKPCSDAALLMSLVKRLNPPGNSDLASRVSAPKSANSATLTGAGTRTGSGTSPNRNPSDSRTASANNGPRPDYSKMRHGWLVEFSQNRFDGGQRTAELATSIKRALDGVGYAHAQDLSLFIADKVAQGVRDQELSVLISQKVHQEGRRRGGMGRTLPNPNP